MATKTFILPTLTTPAGELHARIWYSAASSSTTTINELVWNMDVIDIPFEVIGKNSTFRFANTKITVFNIDNAFETNNIYDSSKIAETFIDIYKDGSIYWSGRVIWEKSRKTDWYKEGSTITYRAYKLYCVDKLEYLSGKTLSDASYVDDMTYATLIGNAAGLIGMSAGLPTATEWALTEASGRKYALGSGGTAQLKIRGLTASDNLLLFLKDFCLAFGLSMYTLNNTLNFVRRNGGTAVTLSDDDIVRPLEKVPVYNDVAYVDVSGHINFNTLYGVGGDLTDNYEIKKSSGTQDEVNAKRNFVLLNDTLYGNTFVDFDGGDSYYPNPHQVPTAGTLTTLDYSLFYTSPHEVESGMLLQYNWDGSALIYDNGSVVKDVPSASRLEFYSTGTAPNTSKEFRVGRAGSTGSRVYKIQKLVDYAHDIYAAYFGDETLKMSIVGVQSPGALFSWNGGSYKPARVTIDLARNKTAATVRKVA
ncbi:MAG TPA: hypothetical protein ENK32_01405 [Anaerolineae bacterium]|nr:hypothetical protein [Anaerolineae bacterium]